MDVHPQPRNQPLVPLLALLMSGATLAGSSGCLSPPIQAKRSLDSRVGQAVVAAQDPVPTAPAAQPAETPPAERVAATRVKQWKSGPEAESPDSAGEGTIVLASNVQADERVEERPERDIAEPRKKGAPLLDGETAKEAERIKAEYKRVEFDDTPAVPLPAQEYLIDLTFALRLAGAQNPTIAGAQEAVRELGAAEMAANALLLPSLTVGGNYDLHRGSLQQSPGRIINVNRQSLYLGAGSRTLAAESLAFPGVRIFTQLADAIYEPLAAAQAVSAGYSESTATQNDILLDVSEAYLNLVASEEQLKSILDIQDQARRLAIITGSYAETGQGSVADARRAETEALLVHSEVQLAQEEVATASAELARLLHLDPSIRLKTVGGGLEIVPLVDPNANLEQLIEIALLRRPELAARNADIAEGSVRVRQEQVRPFLPLISAGMSAGGFGGGASGNQVSRGVNIVGPYSIHSFAARTDIDVFAVWTLQNMGLGNYQLQQRRQAEMNQAIQNRSIAYNDVREQVSAAYTEVNAQRQRVEVAQSRLKEAAVGYDQEFKAMQAAEGLPIEALDSLSRVNVARRTLIFAVINYNQAQFRLFVALGQTPTENQARTLSPNTPPGVEVPEAPAGDGAPAAPPAAE
ncbi:MAG TPA: TolC family protein [Planctomycetaceae bacterium]|nr:TolC family protein [Planctomycetaceae bacterium]